MATKIKLSNILQPLDGTLVLPSVDVTDSITLSNTEITVSNNVLTVDGSNIATETFVTNAVQGVDNTDEITEGTTNLFYTDARVQTYLDSGLTVNNSLTVTGDFTVSGNTTFVNTNNLEIEDLNITLASGAVDASSANGAGITIDGANAQITYNATEDAISLNKKLSLGTDFNLYVNESGHKVIETDQDSGLIAAKGKYFFVTGTTGGNARTSLSATLGGSVNLRYDDTTRFETTATGADVTGTLLADNIRSFGNANSVTVNTTTVNAETVNATSFNGSVANTTLRYSTTTLLDGDGEQGNFAFDALNQKLKIHTGSVWVDAISGVGGGTANTGETDAVATLEKFTFDVTTTTNTVQGADTNGNTLSYVIDGSQNVEVFVNGIKNIEGASYDYVASTGTSVSFTYDLTAGDVVDVQVYELLTQDAFYLKTETYTQTETNQQISTALGGYVPSTGGTFTGDIAINGSDLIIGTEGRELKFKTSSSNSYGVLKSGDTYGTNSFEIHGWNGVTVAIDENDNNTGFFQVVGNSTSDNLFLIKQNGNVGIGTDNPLDLLHINSDSGDARQIIDAHTGFDAELKYAVNGDVKYTTGYDAGSDSFVIGTTNVDTEKRLVIDSNGNVGIGTNPNSDSNLHIKSTAAIIRTTSTNTVSGLQLLVEGGTGAVFRIYDVTGDEEVVRIDGSRNVGIGTDTPVSKLDVNGTVTATSVALPNGWTVTESGGDIYIAVSGSNKMKLHADGTLDVAGDINANATIS